MAGVYTVYNQDLVNTEGYKCKYFCTRIKGTLLYSMYLVDSPYTLFLCFSQSYIRAGKIFKLLMIDE